MSIKFNLFIKYIIFYEMFNYRIRGDRDNATRLRYYKLDFSQLEVTEIRISVITHNQKVSSFGVDRGQAISGRGHAR